MRRIGLAVVFAISLLVAAQAEGQPSAIPLIAVLNEGSALLGLTIPQSVLVRAGEIIQ